MSAFSIALFALANFGVLSERPDGYTATRKQRRQWQQDRIKFNPTLRRR